MLRNKAGASLGRDSQRPGKHPKLPESNGRGRRRGESRQRQNNPVKTRAGRQAGTEYPEGVQLEAKKRGKPSGALSPLPDHVDCPHAHVPRHLNDGRPDLFDFNRGDKKREREPTSGRDHSGEYKPPQLCLIHQCEKVSIRGAMLQAGGSQGLEKRQMGAKEGQIPRTCHQA